MTFVGLQAVSKVVKIILIYMHEDEGRKGRKKEGGNSDHTNHILFVNQLSFLPTVKLIAELILSRRGLVVVL